MSEDATVAKVGDWLADGWDWDQIGAALGMDGDQVYERYGEAAAEYVRRKEDRVAGEDL